MPTPNMFHQIREKKIDRILNIHVIPLAAAPAMHASDSNNNNTEKNQRALKY